MADSQTETSSNVVSSLSDSDIVMNFPSIDELCLSWNNKVNDLNLTSERVINGLKPLTDYNIYINYTKSLAVSVSSLTSTITEVTSMIKSTATSQQETDYAYSNYVTSGTSYTRNSGSRSDTSANTTVNNNNQNTKMDTNKDSNNQNISVSDYVGLSIALSSIATSKNSSLENVLNDFNGTLIKEKVMASPNISEDMKESLCNLDDNNLKKVLMEAYSNGALQTIDEKNLEYLNSYIDKVALRNNITSSELLENSSNKNILTNAMKNYEVAISLLDDKDGMEVAGNIYDGQGIENISEDIVYAVRDVIDMVADKNNTTAESIITTKNYINDASGSKKFMAILNQSTDVQKIIKSVYAKRG